MNRVTPTYLRSVVGAQLNEGGCLALAIQNLCVARVKHMAQKRALQLHATSWEARQQSMQLNPCYIHGASSRTQNKAHPTVLHPTLVHVNTHNTTYPRVKLFSHQIFTCCCGHLFHLLWPASSECHVGCGS